MARWKIILPALLLAGLLFLAYQQDVLYVSINDFPGQRQEDSSPLRLPSFFTGETGERDSKEGNKDRGRTGVQEPGPGAGRAESRGGKAGDNAGSGQEVTVEDIKEEYRPRFMALKEEYEARLYDLARQAINEYRGYRERGEDPPVVDLARKYLRQGRQLESECDREVNRLLNQMREDLKKENLPLTLVEQARREYERQKTQRRMQLIKAGLEFAGL